MIITVRKEKFVLKWPVRTLTFCPGSGQSYKLQYLEFPDIWVIAFYTGGGTGKLSVFGHVIFKLFNLLHLATAMHSGYYFSLQPFQKKKSNMIFLKNIYSHWQNAYLLHNQYCLLTFFVNKSNCMSLIFLTYFTYFLPRFYSCYVMMLICLYPKRNTVRWSSHSSDPCWIQHNIFSSTHFSKCFWKS